MLEVFSSAHLNLNFPRHLVKGHLIFHRLPYNAVSNRSGELSVRAVIKPKIFRRFRNWRLRLLGTRRRGNQ